MRRTIRQRLSELARDSPADPSPQISPIFPSPSLRNQYSPRPAWRRRNIISTSSAIDGESWPEAAPRLSRGLWRLEDSLPDHVDQDSDYLALHENVTRRHLMEAAMQRAESHIRNSLTPVERMRAHRSPEQIFTGRNESELRRERPRQVWGEIDSDEYTESPLASL